jgi:hypothetical protein
MRGPKARPEVTPQRRPVLDLLPANFDTRHSTPSGCAVRRAMNAILDRDRLASLSRVTNRSRAVARA